MTAAPSRSPWSPNPRSLRVCRTHGPGSNETRNRNMSSRHQPPPVPLSCPSLSQMPCAGPAAADKLEGSSLRVPRREQPDSPQRGHQGALPFGSRRVPGEGELSKPVHAEPQTELSTQQSAQCMRCCEPSAIRLHDGESAARVKRANPLREGLGLACLRQASGH